MTSKTLFSRWRRRPPEPAPEPATAPAILQEDQQALFNHDLSLLGDNVAERGEQLQKEAEKEVRTAAEDSLKRLHFIQRGHCPTCGANLRRHLSAAVCDACGWHSFDVPREGPVRVHLTTGGDPVEGEHCYVVKTGAVLVLRNDVVIARVPATSVSWVEYVWNDDEIQRRHHQILDQLQIECGWCNKSTDPDADGFHLVHVAFGATQERYCFCSDECYDAFRKLYPARVHRNCYERNCDDCELCVKRYGSEADGVRMLAKDYLKLRKEAQPPEKE